MGFVRGVAGAGLGEVIEAAAGDVQLEGEELFEGKVSARGDFLIFGIGEVNLVKRVVSGEFLDGGGVGCVGQQIRDSAGFNFVKEPMDEGAEGTLGDTCGERVDGCDPVYVYRGALEVRFQDFVFRVVDHEAFAGEFRFAVGDEFVVDGNIFVDPGEVEPAEDDGIGEGGGFGFLDGGFEDLFAAAEAAEGAVGDDAVDAEGVV